MNLEKIVVKRLERTVTNLDNSLNSVKNGNDLSSIKHSIEIEMIRLRHALRLIEIAEKEMELKGE